MAFSGGTYTLPGAALNTGDTVSATENNTFRNDVATAFNLTWLRNGTAAATADIPMGGYSFTNCAAVGSNGSLLLKVNNGTTAATLDTSGNLGIGTTSPALKLHVSGDAGGNTFKLLANTTVSGSDATIFRPADNTMAFSTNGSERARIDSSGNLLVARTNASFYGGTVKFGVEQTSGSAWAAGFNANGNAIVFNHTGNTSSAVGSISVTTSATAYNTSSDYRLKNITGPVTGAKDFIMALQPKQGTWKIDGSPFVGFVAHEFQEVSPSSVSGVKDAVDGDGNPIYQAMQASSPEVMANLIAHIQNLETRLAALEQA
jgi:hypothetical protein